MGSSVLERDDAVQKDSNLECFLSSVAACGRIQLHERKLIAITCGEILQKTVASKILEVNLCAARMWR